MNIFNFPKCTKICNFDILKLCSIFEKKDLKSFSNFELISVTGTPTILDLQIFFSKFLCRWCSHVVTGAGV